MRLVRLAPLVLLAVALLPPGARAEGPSREDLRVLFIGNSFTRFHGLHRMVARLAQHEPGAPRVRTEVETRAGCTLRRHWIGRRAVRRIRARAYTHVVLQGHSLRPIDRPGELEEYARRFEREIAGSGARTVLYATWARKEGSRFYRRRGDDLPDPAAMQGRIDRVYGRLAHDLDAALAPVGRAWLGASQRHPDLSLHGRDGVHPTIAGQYLSACVLYGAITGRSPEGSAWWPYPMQEETARALQAVAAGTLAE